LVSLIAANAYYFCLRHKSNKKSSQEKCFFAAQGLCPANQAKPGLQSFYPASLAFALASVKICYALPLRTRPPSFCLILAEALLLTRKKPHPTLSKGEGFKKTNATIIKNTQARQKARARVFCLWGEGSFCLDLLVTFGSSQK
jgi:hypothetical protein